MDYLDITYSGIPFFLMTVIEPSLAVTLACVPLLRPLLGKGSSRYSATGTRTYGAYGNAGYGGTMSFRGLNTVESGMNDRCHRVSKMARSRSSCPSVPAEMLQYQYEMGLDKEGMPVDVQELMPTTEYHYQAEVSTGHESDGSSRGKCSDDMEISPISNIVVKQEWSVSNEVKLDV